MDRKITLSKALVPAAVIIGAALIYISPVLSGIRNIGSSDWDNQLFYHGAAVKTALSYRQFPLWNPYHCGGNPMLASPEISFLSPTFVLDLFFGEVVGVKLAIVFFTIMGFWGMRYLSRTLGMGRVSSFLPAVIFMTSSWYALRVTEGHTGFLAFALLPSSAAFYIKSLDDGEKGFAGPLKMLIVSSLFLAWMIFAGGVYPFIVSALFFSVFSILSAVSRRSFVPLINAVLIAVLTLLFSAVKTIPQYEFIREFPRKTAAVEYHSGKILVDSLFKRGQKVTEQDPSFYPSPGESEEEYLQGFWGGKRPWGWHEYGAFVGFISFALYLAGFLRLKSAWPWVLLSFIALLLSLGDFSPLNLWGVLRRLPVFSSLHGPSRIAILFVFSISIVAAFSLSAVEEGRVLSRWGGLGGKAGVFAALMTLSVFIEMVTVSRPILKDAFTLPPYTVSERRDFVQLIVSDPTSTNYPYFLNNVGVLNCYESQHPSGKVAPYGDDRGNVNPAYRGEAYVEGDGEAAITYFSPNRVEIEASLASGARVVLNQNYFKGWTSMIDGVKGDVEPYEGLVSVTVPPGPHRVVFRYSPLSFKIGLMVTLASLISSALFAFLTREGKAP